MIGHSTWEKRMTVLLVTVGSRLRRGGRDLQADKRLAAKLPGVARF
jgi:hypothetical protein